MEILGVLMMLMIMKSHGHARVIILVIIQKVKLLDNVITENPEDVSQRKPKLNTGSRS